MDSVEFTLEEMVDFFKAAGDVNRLKIINLLASNSVDKLCVADVSKILGITQPAASQHIKVLKNFGIVYPNKVGYRVYYHIEFDKLSQMQKKLNAMFDSAYQKCEDNNV